MSIESYILGLQKNPSPGKIGKIVLGGLELLAGIYEKGVVKKYEKAGRNARRMPIPVISVGNITAGGTGNRNAQKSFIPFTNSSMFSLRLRFSGEVS